MSSPKGIAKKSKKKKIKKEVKESRGRIVGSKRTSKATRAGLTFPPTRFHHRLQKGNYSRRVGVGAGLYIAAIIEYLCAEILELSGNAAIDNNKKRIIPRHIMMAIRNDEELNKLLNTVYIANAGVLPSVHRILLHTLEQRRRLQDKGELPSDVELSTQVLDSGTSEEITNSQRSSKSPRKERVEKKKKKKEKSNDSEESGEKKSKSPKESRKSSKSPAKKTPPKKSPPKKSPSKKSPKKIPSSSKEESSDGKFHD